MIASVNPMATRRRLTSKSPGIVRAALAARMTLAAEFDIRND